MERQIVEQGEGCFEHEGVRYHYASWRPAGRVPGRPLPAEEGLASVVLVHGFAQSARSWRRVGEALGQTRPVFAIDLVGHGKSERPAAGSAYALAAQGRALRAGVERVARAIAPPVVVGYSMGGRVVLAALVDAPEAFAANTSGLVLESAGLGPATVDERARTAAADAARAAQLRERGVEAFMEEWERLPLFASQAALPAEVRAAVRAERLANDAEVLARTFEHAGQHAMPPRAEATAALRALAARDVAIAYAAGALDVKYAALAADLRERVPSARVAVIPGAGHDVHLEAPKEFLALFAR